ncbi:hypothetical protein MJG53_012499 [Ovis ammon polii x Ovis aries]|uniref:Uncharacterized protein n=1 Tax=Ovis ammon polii x Ovis aries TaxID=2918886 RepID=A0ACB9UNM3_9CETA|nr:hypothetical protein MJG53_012499 [Ovis ammon polii x Ovis aries]
MPASAVVTPRELKASVVRMSTQTGVGMREPGPGCAYGSVRIADDQSWKAAPVVPGGCTPPATRPGREDLRASLQAPPPPVQPWELVCSPPLALGWDRRLSLKDHTLPLPSIEGTHVSVHDALKKFQAKNDRSRWLLLVQPPCRKLWAEGGCVQLWLFISAPGQWPQATLGPTSAVSTFTLRLRACTTHISGPQRHWHVSTSSALHAALISKKPGPWERGKQR